MYQLRKVFNEGFVGMWSPLYGKQFWTKCKLRKDPWCAMCETKLKKGDIAFRPQTNGGNRMVRICENCIKKCIEKFNTEEV